MLSLGAGHAHAQGTPPPAEGPVDIVEVSGLVDDVVADDLTKAIDRAETGGAQALIVQMNSKGAVVSPERMARLAEAIHDAKVPVALWVGPSGSRALGLTGQLLGAAPVTAMAPGHPHRRLRHPAARRRASSSTSATAATSSGSSTMGPTEARERNVLRPTISDQGVPVLRNMLLAIDGLEYQGKTLEHGRGASAGRRQGGAGAGGRAPLLQAAARAPPHAHRRQPAGHLPAADDRPVAPDLRVVHRRGRRGRASSARAASCWPCYGLGVLPINGWALAAALRRVLRPRHRRADGRPAGLDGHRAGALRRRVWFLFRDGLRPSWITLLAGIGGVALAFIVGMPSMVRARFATPTIGREWMIGELGVTGVAIDPIGVAVVRGAQWRARTNRATPLAKGEPLRVVAIDGFTLEVEPEEGGAKDHRERRRSRAARGVIGMLDGGSRARRRRRSPLAALPRSLGGFVGADARRYRPRPAGSLVVNLSTRTYAALRNEGVSP